ncbi:cation-transporting P-type ATPase [Arthrobacter alpinus]|nr:cation-transporting P-type ATPase [Arthrobacter alpinus]
MIPSATVEAAKLTQHSIAGTIHLSVEEVLRELGSTQRGLGGNEAARRLSVVGPNALRTHKASPWVVLGRQLRSPILILLIVTAGLSLFLGMPRIR